MSIIHRGTKSYVYLIGFEDKIKIGKSNNPSNRLSMLQTGIPNKLNIYGLIGCNSEVEALTLEAELHKTYKHLHIRGEWFTLNSIEVECILKANEDMTFIEIPQTEIVEAMKDLSNGAYKLLMYYYSRRDGWRFIDANIAIAIDSSERQVKKFRKELIDKQYLLVQKGQVDVYFIGKLAVDKFKNELYTEEEVLPTEPVISRGNHNE